MAVPQLCMQLCFPYCCHPEPFDSTQDKLREGSHIRLLVEPVLRDEILRLTPQNDMRSAQINVMQLVIILSATNDLVFTGM